MAQRICFYFYRQLSVWKFMPKLLVNVFSKLAMSQDLGPISRRQEDPQGRPDTFAFFLSSNVTLECYAKFEGQRFLEPGDVSIPGTDFASSGASPRVA